MFVKLSRNHGLRLALLLVLLGACRKSGPVDSNSDSLHDLTSLQQFAAAFDESNGSPRLVLLLSPT